jgi:hypothetical protein
MRETTFKLTLHGFELQQSLNEKRALEHYLIAKAKAEREGQAWLN